LIAPPTIHPQETGRMTTPANLAGKIDHLKSLFVNAEDFSKPMGYFFDVLAVDPAFLSKGRPLKDKAIKARFQAVLEIMHRQVEPESTGKGQLLTLLWLKDYEFAHGACTIGNRLGVTFYFRDLDMGLSSLASLRPGDPVLFSRFSVQDCPDPQKSYQFDRSGHRH
jgi:hypothetical protein